MAKRKKWSEQSVVAAIKERQANSLALNHQSVVRDDEPLAGAARRYFGSWGAALAAAGMDASVIHVDRAPRKPNGHWDKPRILDGLRALHAAGVPLNAHAVQLANGGLESAAKYHFGTFAAAIEALGLDYAAVRLTEEWTQERVTNEIQRIHALGADLSDNTVNVLHPSLYGAAKTHFGGWRQAIESAGIDPDSTRRTNRWTRERILSHYRRAMEMGLRVSALLRWDEAAKGVIYDHFSSFSELYEAPGIEEVERENQFTNRLRECRTRKGMTQEQVGRKIGYTARAIGLYELGQIEPSIRVAIKLAHALGVSVEHLFP